jgi:pimeloyl-ACP methyl ester carboxylesterase
LNLWHKYLSARERALAASNDSLKLAGDPSVGFNLLQPKGPSEDLASLHDHVRAAINNADAYFALKTEMHFVLKGASLNFSAPLMYGSSDIARAQLFEARSRGRAVVLLPHWNATRSTYETFARALSIFGITCLVLSMPYHDERQTIGVGFAREMVCENIGLTIKTNRQAVVEARACLSWLESHGYPRLGVIGVSLGSSIASIVAALDNRVSAAVLLLMADDFAEVVWTGTATRHLQNSLARSFSFKDVQSAWTVISPSTYAERLSRRLENLLIVSGALDRVFLPPLTERYVKRLHNFGLTPTWVRLNCGHYTLSHFPYSVVAFLQTLNHLKKWL